EVGRELLELRRRTKKTVCLSWTIPPSDGFDLVVAGGMYVFPEPSRAIGVLGRVAGYSTAVTREPIDVNEIPRFEWKTLVPETVPGTVISEDACHKILRAAGLPVAEGKLAKSENDAAAMALAVKFPVAMKGISGAVTHRAAAGLLELDLRSEEEVRDAYRR